MATSGLIRPLELDRTRVDRDLAAVDRFGYIDSYDEFVCGSWRTCMLRNASGDGDDGEIRDYEGPAQLTEHGHKTPYLTDLIDERFDTNRLRFARVTRLAAGSVVVPHRDYVELARPLVRIHVPLATDPHAYASELETIYHMAAGEAWFLDATTVHSIANFADLPRIHLLLDFTADSPTDVFRTPPAAEPRIPPKALVPRRPFRSRDEAGLRALGDLADRHNFMDVVALIIKKYFTTDIAIVDVFTWLDEIARLCGVADVAARASWLRTHALVTRTDAGSRR